VWSEPLGDARKQLRTPAGGELQPVPERSRSESSASGQRRRRRRRRAGLPRAGATSSQAVGAWIRRVAAPTATAYLPSAVQLLRNVGARLRRHVGRRGAPLPGAALRRPGHQHSSGRLLAGTGHLHDLAPRGARRPLQLHMELLPRGLHQ